MKQLSKLGVPISHSKCLSSSIFSEFAGKVITTDGSVDFVKAPKPGHFPKKGSLKRDKIDVPLNIDQFINYCKVLGSTDSVISGVPKKYREKALQFAALPEQFGGAGVNPKGISLRDRVLAFVQDDVQTAFPLMGDIQSSLVQASVMKTHVHVNDVCSYVNDQLNRWYSIIEEHIKDSPLVGLSSVLDPRMLRSLVSQLLDSSQEDNSVTFAGTVRRTSTVPSVFQDWKVKLSSLFPTIKRVVEKNSFADLDANLQSTYRDLNGLLNQKSWEENNKTASMVVASSIELGI